MALKQVPGYDILNGTNQGSLWTIC